ncbi:hypothetical protein F4V43_07180 [Paenibacillus spiritus]|uniref:N-acetyltransferase domain-containing protein n=1 Tax=Paenibacillus spiritus TaxID=2496557 RepID=A0A5J5GCT2_9BACL|nr:MULTISPECIES: hypothetical protein [Paenibacillus]KAA9005851.1 hypothetical protein F4V43_07180 [Paenibacillus spiritus]
MEQPGWRLRKPEAGDIDAMLELNYAIYPEEWHVDRSYVEKVMSLNPEVYNVLETPEGIQGIFSLFPLPQPSYERMLQGTLEEDELTAHLLDYRNPGPVWLYLISLIVDIRSPQRRAYARSLIRAIPDELRRLGAAGIDVQEIGAIAVTGDGDRSLQRIGFAAAGTVPFYGRDYPVYRARPEDLYRAIGGPE